MPFQDYWNRGAQTGGQRPNTQFSWGQGGSSWGTAANAPKPPATSSWGWNASNPYAKNLPQPSYSSTPIKQDAGAMINMTGAGPAYSEETPFVNNTPMVNNTGAGNPVMGPEIPWQDIMSFMGGLAPTPVNGPMLPAYQQNQTMLPYATLENLQAYMNPFYQSMIDQGSMQIQKSAAARGRLRSSQTINDIGNWATNAQSQAYNDAMNAFMGDRNAMYDMFNSDRAFDWDRYKYENDLAWGLYGAEKDDYNAQMKSFYDMLSGISKVGIDAAGKSGDLAADSSTALANLFMSMAQMNAQSGVAGAQQDGNFMSSLFGLMPLLMQMGKGG